MFDIICNAIINHHKNYLIFIKRNKELITWINDITILFQNYNIQTKIYCIINGVTELPKCKFCGKTITKDVKAVYTGFYDYCSLSCGSKSEETRKKIKETCNKNYGCDYYCQTKEFRIRYEKTSIKKYGVKNNMQCEKGKAEYCKSIKEKYGTDWYLSTEDSKEKRKNTNNKKYRCNAPAQVREFRIKQQYRYMYDNISFDSSPEIALYIWLKDNNIDFEYNPNVRYEYSVNDSVKYYFPDFRIEGYYYELKGPQFIENDKWICPWDRSRDYEYEEKHKCVISNNVKIIQSKEYNIYCDYCKNKFNDSHWYRKFKRHE